MTDSAGIPGGTGAAGGGPRPPAGRRRRLLRWIGLGAVLLVLAGAATGWWLYEKLDGNITSDTSAEAELRRFERERPVHLADGAQNILLIGSDSRSGRENAGYGQDGGTQRSDTTILLHLAADRGSVTAVSIPRDLMTEVPACRAADGTRTAERFAQFNWAFQWGGAACTIRTVERLTGVRIDHHMVLDFGGFKQMVDAVGGVEVCLPQPVDDAEAHLRLPAGRHLLQGEQALGFVRARYGLGNGSDTERIQRQQQFLGSLVKKVQSNGVLLNPARLYPLLDAATSALTTDPGLASLRGLYELVRSVRDIPSDEVRFLTVPRRPYAPNPNRDELLEPDAGQLFQRLRLDRPVTVTPPVPTSTATPAPAPTAVSAVTSASSAAAAAEPVPLSPAELFRDAVRAESGTGSAPFPDPTFTGTTAGTAECR
ncbi:Putative transcriptional regulator YvhJ [Streptomyces lavendulae subsp. lavendulae]|uniref:Transcriptional regulator YvhJ n=1 Tax=Streptomyces lavendulae subsp. lavendulae TaxID=58340 RepID=A0A2K8PJU0_STRLA|nr:Putative transcriptional regulator YvhJ [Streptomyces lavendulae subsp. lavendulae]QUQ56208.1 Polyisoprenyl-teichoic acid--peptidoglycan teichoic acid transferase TagU [Streptomyces lavendulae subsp. lavendulae]